jgi:hypothetical protein
MGQQRRILQPPTDKEAESLPKMEGFGLDIKPTTPPSPGIQDQLRGLQGQTPFKEAGDFAYGLGITPSQIGGNVSGLLKMFTQNPLTTADQLMGLVTDPIKRTIDDPKVRRGLIYLAQNASPGNIGLLNPELASAGMTGVPGIGNQFVEPQQRIERGDPGGMWQALGAGAQIPASVMAPEVGRVLTGEGSVPGWLANKVETSARRNLVDVPADLPLDVAREGVQAGLKQGLFRSGIRTGQDKAKVLAENATSRAIDAAQPGAVTQPSRPTMMGNLFGRTYNSVRGAATPFLNPENPFGGGGPTRLTPFPPTQSIGVGEATGNALDDIFSQRMGQMGRETATDVAAAEEARALSSWRNRPDPGPTGPPPVAGGPYKPELPPRPLEPEPPPVAPTPPPSTPGMELPGPVRRELPAYPGTLTNSANPSMPPVRMSGPGAGVTFSENVEKLINNPQMMPEQVSFIEEAVTALQNDPRRLGLTPADRIRFAEGARFSEGDVGNTARTLGRQAFAADERAAIRSAAPATTPHLNQIDELDKAQRLFSLTKPESLGNTLTSEFKRLKYPLHQTAYDIFGRGLPAAAPKIGELVRLAILAQLANQQPPER